MRKQLFCMGLLLGSLFMANAQEDCANAQVITTNSTISVAAVDGTFPTGSAAAICSFAEGNAAIPYAVWYSFTPTGNGLMTVDAGIDANLPADDTAFDTRLRILSGTCAALNCVATSDDINYPSDLRSRISNLPVMSGVTYYIVFDNRWSDEAFDFDFSFTSATCFPVSTGFEFVGEPTSEEVTITWDAPTLGTPQGYQVEYGEEGFTQGEGEVMNVATNQATFDELTGGTTYEFYIRTFCGGTDYSMWTGPIAFTPPYGPSDLPYEFGFEADPLNGGWTAFLVNETGGDWGIYMADETVPAYEGDQFAAAVGAAAASDAWFFSRGINLEADDEVHISYYIAKAVLAGAGNVNNLEVTIGTDATVAGQTTTLATFDDYSVTDYTQQMHTFTAPSSGVYYLGYHYTAPAHVANNFGGILLDAVSVNSELGIIDLTDSGFVMYPNPVSDVLTISNPGALINSIEIVDLNGRIVKTIDYPGTSELQVNVSDLSAGMYLINTYSGKGLITNKVIKK